MKLGYGLDIWNQPRAEIPAERIRLIEQLGFDSVWTAEIYGADAITPLAWLAATTSELRLGTAVMQLAARPPTTAAMQVATVDALSGGRVICGLGVSGPQIVEGWYGRPWRSPLAELTAYVDIMRQVFRRDAPVTHDGEPYPLPYAGPDALGVGKALKPILHPRPDVPIFLATGGPRNVALTAACADGWLPMGYTPDSAAVYTEALAAGTARRDPRLGPLEIQAGATVRITDDVGATLAAMKPATALLVGGYGTREHNFHRDAMVRRGYGDTAARIQELFMAGYRADAAAAVPDDYLDDAGLYGSPTRVRQRFARWTDRTAATGLTIRADQDEALALMAQLAECRPRHA
jgi:F420-dependent oxidoreductase-like protein